MEDGEEGKEGSRNFPSALNWLIQIPEYCVSHSGVLSRPQQANKGATHSPVSLTVAITLIVWYIIRL